ncbi:Piwi-domain-containing protein [Acephala macrosclerotiorum]|nr:Piwi-domain-containing protein [Acephala macrosclerotiorum]
MLVANRGEQPQESHKYGNLHPSPLNSFTNPFGFLELEIWRTTCTMSNSSGKTYPLHDQQVCDNCGKSDPVVHEVKDCKSLQNGPPGGHCKSCGHGDHNAKKCTLVPFGRKAQDMPDEVINRFTPKFRAKILEQKAKVMPSTKPTSTPTKSPSIPFRSSPSKATSPSSSLKNPASPKSDLESVTDSKGKRGSRVSEKQQQLWDAEERRMPRPEDRPKSSPAASNKRIQTKFFEMRFDSKIQLYRYSITLGEVDDHKPIKKKDADGEELPERKRKIKRETKRYMIEELLNQNKPSHDNWATDYDAVIISVRELYPGSAKVVNQDTPAPHTRSPKKKGDPRPIVNSSVRFLGIVDIDHLNKHVAGKDYEHNLDADLKSLNIISWRNITNKTFVGGLVKNKFYPDCLRDSKGQEADKESQNPSPYLIRRGFFSSMRPGQGMVLLNVNTTTSAFFSPIRLSTWISQNWEGQTPSVDDFKKALKGVRVTFEPHGKTSRKWVICGLSRETKINSQTFDLSPGRPQPVYDYLYSKYPKWSRVFNKNALCVNVGGKDNPVWYPADMLTIVDWQVVTRVLPETFASDMVKKAEHTPSENKDLILETALEQLGLKGSNQFYQSFGTLSTTTFLEIDYVKCKVPKLKFKATETSGTVVTDGSWNLSGQVFFSGANTLRTLGIISFCEGVDSGKIIDLGTALKLYGVSPVAKNVKLPGWSENISDPGKGIDREAFQKVMTAAPGKLNQNLEAKPLVVLVVLLKKSIELYSELKRWSDCVAGIPTVCITEQKLDTANHNLWGNICLKFNIKLRGVNHQLHPPSSSVGPSGAPKETMIVGADVTHPGQFAEGCPSMAAVVATIDDTSGHYLGSARQQDSRQEYISDLAGMMSERTRAWVLKARTRNLSGKDIFPTHILFYRDGVSESQYGMVRHEELKQIKDGCLSYFESARKTVGLSIPSTFKWNPKITLLVVTKRHHARFFPKVGSTDGNADLCKGNLRPGTLADSKVVTPNQIEFYLQSHQSPKGTAKSSHYVVIEDEKKYKIKDLQEITHNLCYAGGRATKALSIYAPARFANFLCNRLRCYMKPCLDSLYPPREKDPKTGALLERAKYDYKDKVCQKLFWSSDPERKNPWASDLDNVMFYL